MKTNKFGLHTAVIAALTLTAAAQQGGVPKE